MLPLLAQSHNKDDDKARLHNLQRRGGLSTKPQSLNKPYTQTKQNLHDYEN